LYYKEGYYVDCSYDKYLSLLKKYSDNHHIKAQTLLSLHFLKTNEYLVAESLLTKSSVKGSSQVQYNLGVLLFKLKKPNFLDWLKKSEKQGNLQVLMMIKKVDNYL